MARSSIVQRLFHMLKSDCLPVKAASQIVLKRHAHFTFKPDSPSSDLGKQFDIYS